MTSKILLPSQWSRLRENLNAYYQIICDGMLYSGLRPDSEFWRFVENPHWYETDGKIHVPAISGIQQARIINLSIEGRMAMDVLVAFTRLGNKRKERNTMRDALRRAAMGDGRVTKIINRKPTKVARPEVMSPDGVNAEMFRETLTAWLIACYPEKKYEVLLSMGMDEETMKKYIGLVFTRQEITAMREHLKGWM